MRAQQLQRAEGFIINVSMDTRIYTASHCVCIQRIHAALADDCFLLKIEK